MIDHNSSKAEVLAAIAEEASELEKASDVLKNDPEVVLAAVSAHKHALDAPENDPDSGADFLFTADVVKDAEAFKHASDALKNDRDFVLVAVAKNGYVLQHAFKQFRKDSLLKRVKNLTEDEFTEDISPAFLALQPLKKKLKQEANPERKKAVATMIAAIEEAIVSHYENPGYQFADAFNAAVETAKPVLEKQVGWRQAIDAAVNAIIRFFNLNAATQHQENPGNHFSFFANPNPVEKETEQAKVAIQSALKAS